MASAGRRRRKGISAWSPRVRRSTSATSHDPDVAEVDLRTLGLHADIPFLLRRPADAIDDFAVHREFDNAIDGDHVVGVPLALALAAVFDRHAAHAPRVVGD